MPWVNRLNGIGLLTLSFSFVLFQLQETGDNEEDEDKEEKEEGEMNGQEAEPECVTQVSHGAKKKKKNKKKKKKGGEIENEPSLAQQVSFQEL